MSIPVRLYPGLVSIYGPGSSTGTNSITPPGTDFNFGVIDQIWTGGMGAVSVGESVLFKRGDVIASVVYSNTIYTLIAEEKIILIETVLP